MSTPDSSDDGLTESLRSLVGDRLEPGGPTPGGQRHGRRSADHIEPSVNIGAGSVVQPNTTISGGTTIGKNCQIGPNTIVVESTIGDGCVVFASVIRDSSLADDVHAGPFCHVRGGSRLEAGVRLGTSAEVNRSRLGKGVKSNHFSYLGDAEVGEGVNIGAGTITCNYDGQDKHQTVIGTARSSAATRCWLRRCGW
jgi:bifunctional UDP-N-acetylglucosamine pyrophosphorylase/glucosamine-1-phosphate N-acetyltransferase